MSDRIYYVYEHIDPKTKESIYIGCGKGQRAYAIGHSKGRNSRYGQRSLEHNNHLEKMLIDGYLPHEWIIFHHRNLSKEEALHLEKQLIRSKKTLYNRSYGIHRLKYNKSDLLKMRGLRENGMSYSKIALEMGCSTMTAHRILNESFKRYKEVLLNEE